MKWDLKERHSKSPRAYQIVSERPQIATQRPSDGVVSPIANNYSTADVACIDQMHSGGKGGGHGPPGPSWPKLRSQQQQQNPRRPTTLKLDVGAAQRAPERLPSPRPQTATLDRPRILDIALLGKIDMSLTRKALLSISSLCAGAPDAAKRNGASPGDGRGGKARRFAGAARRGRQQQREDDGSGSTAPPTPRRQLRAPAPRRRPAPAGDLEAGAGAVPQPCTTCGRPEQPERLHSHPPARSHHHQQAPQPQPQPPPPQPPKSSVRKPVPINFRSAASASVSSAAQQQQQQTDKASAPPPAAAAPAAAPATSAATAPAAAAPAATAPALAAATAPAATAPAAAPKAPGRPRTVVCYLCGREFGTKSYPLHEPHCLQKWQRENSLLPPQLQREPPPRPPPPPASRDWNLLAWEAAQGSLVPCENCGRTFNPDRLEVHQRSCRMPQPKRPPPQEEQSQPPAQSQSEPLSAAAAAALARVGHACRWCGRLFGSASLRIHEAQCARRRRSPPPAAPAAPGSPPPPAAAPAAAAAAASPEPRPRGPRMLLCYLCGRGFTQASLHIHEAQCLKRWHLDNDRLPPAQRRPTPERPAVVLTAGLRGVHEGRALRAAQRRLLQLLARPGPGPGAGAGESGALDLDATVEAAWQSHLQQLVPCQGCGRTFYPDRLEVHRRSCKGQGRR